MKKKQSYSTSEVAKYCHVTADMIRKWAESGRIKVFKTPGGHRRIRHEELLRFLRSNNIPVHQDLSGTGQKVLVVDDDSAAASLIRRSFDQARSPFDFEVAEDAFAAGHQMATFRPDVVLISTALPGVDTFDICRRLRQMPDYAGTHIIAMTPPDYPAPPDGRPENGISVFLRKPVTPDNLRRALARLGIEFN